MDHEIGIETPPDTVDLFAGFISDHPGVRHRTGLNLRRHILAGGDERHFRRPLPGRDAVHRQLRASGGTDFHHSGGSRNLVELHDFPLARSGRHAGNSVQRNAEPFARRDLAAQRHVNLFRQSRRKRQQQNVPVLLSESPDTAAPYRTGFAPLAPAQRVEHQPVLRPHLHPVQPDMVERINPDAVLRQDRFDRLFRRSLQTCDEVDCESAVQHPVIHAAAADHPQVFLPPGEGDIRIDAVFRFELLAVGVVLKVGRDTPRQVAGGPQHVGNPELPPVDARHHREVEPHAPGAVGEVGDSEILFGVRPPVREREIVNAVEIVIVRHAEISFLLEAAALRYGKKYSAEYPSDCRKSQAAEPGFPGFSGENPP